MKRDVYLRHEPNQHGILVVYFGRLPRTRKLHSQYDDRVKTMAEVEKLVRQNVVLRLVCAISGKPI